MCGCVCVGVCRYEFCNVWVCVCLCGCVCVGVCRYEFCNVWVCVDMSFVMCGCFDNCVDVLVIRVLVFNVFCIVCTVFFVLFRLCIFTLICY